VDDLLAAMQGMTFGDASEKKRLSNFLLDGLLCLLFNKK
jgi:hypothetical protein